MRTDNIKSDKHFHAVGQIWHTRIHKLYEYWSNETNDLEKRNRAGNLWLEMCCRAQALISSQMERILPKMPDHVRKGGFVVGPGINYGRLPDNEPVIPSR